MPRSPAKSLTSTAASPPDTSLDPPRDAEDARSWRNGAWTRLLTGLAGRPVTATQPEIDLVGADRLPVARKLWYVGSVKWSRSSLGRPGPGRAAAQGLWSALEIEQIPVYLDDAERGPAFAGRFG